MGEFNKVDLSGYKNLTTTQAMVAMMYKDREGKPIILSPSQERIFTAVSSKVCPRIHCMCHTRFGKSMTVGLAALTRLTTYPEKWAIIAGTTPKAKIIMDYVITHIFDNDYTKARFVPEKGESIDEIRKHRNKNHLTFDTGKTENGASLLSELTIGSAKDALGYGAENVIEDEAALIPDDQHSLVMRMLGDRPHDNFLVKIGNPFNRNHFLDSYRDQAYAKIVVDCYQSLKEGRITQQVIDENKRYSWFKILYECMFPSGNEVDELGYMHLVLDKEIAAAQQRRLEPYGQLRLGVDVAKGGRNFNCWVLRGENFARKLRKDKEENSVTIAETTIGFMNEYHISASDVFIDDTGVGHGVVSVLKNRGLEVNAVNFGEAATRVTNDSGQEVASNLLNVRAECYAGDEGLQTWVKHTGYLEPDDDWEELLRIRYRKNLGGKTQIEPKQEMIKKGIESPDVADALALTFAKVKKTIYNGINVEQVLASGAISEFGGLAPINDGIPG